jgi:hypothetical protein
MKDGSVVAAVLIGRLPPAAGAGAGPKGHHTTDQVTTLKIHGNTFPWLGTFTYQDNRRLAMISEA